MFYEWILPRRGAVARIGKKPARPRTAVRQRALLIECLESRLALSIVAGGTGAGNTTPPIDDPGFYNVGSRGGASAIYLGNGWVLTAAHVGAGGTTFNSTWYDAVPGSAIQIVNPPGAAYTTYSDLTMFQIAGRPNLPSLSIDATAPQVGWNVTMIGNGRDRAPDLYYFTSSWAISPTPAAYAGYIVGSTQSIRWGTNTIGSTGFPTGAGANSNSAFSTQFDNIPNDAQGYSGDSGGGVFHKDGSGNWSLVGVMFSISTNASQPSNLSIFGNQTFIANLSVYRSQILSIMGANHAPSGANQTVTTWQGAAFTFAIGDFGFSDPSDTPANALQSVRISTLPSAGVLMNNNVAIVAGQYVSATDISGGKLTFVPAGTGSGAGYANFTFQVQDNGGAANGGVDLDPTPNTITINVTNINDAPSGANTTVGVAVNNAYAFSLADFGFSDASDASPNSLQAVKVSALPTVGSLTNNGVAVTAGQFVSAADINAGLLRFTPAVNATGVGYATFTFQLQDNGGTANGGIDLDPTPNSITVNVTPVNHAPVGVDKTITMLEGAVYAFVASDFGFSDPNDTPANTQLAVRISTLPVAGILTNNGVGVSAGQNISLASINAGLLRYTPPTNANGVAYASFMFQVQDNGGTASGGVDLDPTPNTITFNVTSVNDAPVGTNKTITMLEGAVYLFTTADFGFSDPNDASANSLLAVKISSTPTAGGLTNNGVTVTAGQLIAVADINAGLLRFTPAAKASGVAYASFTFQVQDNGGASSGGVDLASPNTITVNVATVNDAPVGADKLITTREDVPYTFTAADFGFSDGNDSPANALLAVRISTLPAAGSLTRNGTAVTAGQYVTVADINAGLLRFTPGANGNGAGYASFTFQVQDNGGTANGGVDLDPTPNTITFNLTAVNDAPTGANQTVTTQQNTAYVFAASDFGFSDANDSPSHSLLAVRINSVPTAGSLTNNGVAVVAGQYISLASINGGLLRFTPAQNASGAGYASFTFQVEDSGGVANGGVDLDPTPKTMTVTVTAAQVGQTPVTNSVWSLSAVPATIDSGDPQGVEVGVKFSSSTSGYITSVRFYKAAGNTGVHTGSLWSATGQLLATGAFTNETASGWQTLVFSSPVAISAGVTYTASYHTNVGHFSVTRGGLSAALTSGPLTIAANGGVYAYGAGGFPSLTYGGSNYWVDVVLSTTPPVDTTAPTVTAFSPAGGATNASTSGGLSITFSEALSAASVSSSSVQLLDGASVVAATVSYTAGSNTVTLTPTAPLANSKTYTISITGGAGGIKDVAGNPLAATVTSTFTTAAAAPATSSVWSTSAVPATVDSGDPQGVEVGVKFSSSTDGYITGVRFYKAVGNTGVHTGSLWSASGQLLATGTFVNETASGWQTLVFASPVAISAGATYTASYHTNVGHFSVTRGGLTSAVTSGPLTVVANGGMYLYGAGGFPSQTYGGSNYWVDVLLSVTAPVDTTAPTIAAFSIANGATSVSTSASVTITFSEALSAASVSAGTVRLLDGVNVVAATVNYTAGSNTVTLTPTTALVSSKTYTISITGGSGGVKDVAGNALAATVTSAFTTAASAPPTSSVWSTSTVPATVDSGDAKSVEVGMKFTVNVNGYITGVRFYKAVTNTGVHTGSLWSSTGELLATGTFVNETASGWQTLLFDTPVAVTAGVTYTASYHTNVGRFSVTRGGFNSAYVSGAFTVPANGGVYSYGAGGFPSQTYGGSNYWVDVLFAS